MHALRPVISGIVGPTLLSYVWGTVSWQLNVWRNYTVTILIGLGNGMLKEQNHSTIRASITRLLIGEKINRCLVNYMKSYTHTFVLYAIFH